MIRKKIGKIEEKVYEEENDSKKEVCGGKMK